jgi:hypothetical protein
MQALCRGLLKIGIPLSFRCFPLAYTNAATEDFWVYGDRGRLGVSSLWCHSTVKNKNRYTAEFLMCLARTAYCNATDV